MPFARRTGRNVLPRNHKYYKDVKNTLLKTLLCSKLDLNYSQYWFIKVHEAWDPCFVLFISNVQQVNWLVIINIFTSTRVEKTIFVHEKHKGIPALQGYQFFLIYREHLGLPVKKRKLLNEQRTKETVFQFCEYSIQSMNYLRCHFGKKWFRLICANRLLTARAMRLL